MIHAIVVECDSFYKIWLYSYLWVNVSSSRL